VTGAVDEESVALDDLLDDRVVEEAGELAMDVVCDADEEFELPERYVVDLDVLGVIEEAILVAELLDGLLTVLTEPEVELNEPTEPLGEEMAGMVVGGVLPLIDEELLFDELGMTDAERELDVAGKLLALDNSRLKEAGVLLGTIWLRGDEVVKPFEGDRAITVGPAKADDEETVLVERPELVLDRTLEELLDAGQIPIACRAKSRL
jgi:hypothetical protein